MEKIVFAIMELEQVTNEICSIALHEIQRQAKILLAENKACVDIVLEKCKEYEKTADNLSQNESSTSAIDKYFHDVPYFPENNFKGSKGSIHPVCSRISSRSSNASSNERQINATEAKFLFSEAKILFIAVHI